MNIKMDPQNKIKKNQSASAKFVNFIEAFKDASPSQPTANPAAAANQENFDFDAFLNAREKKIRHQERTRFEAVRREEQIIFSREQNQVKVQIENLQTQIQALAKEHVGLIQEVDKASFQVVARPGIYHKNFFERLLQLIKLARKKISESRTWLHMQNHRAKNKSGYWGGVKKSGTSFMLSGERTVSTQTG